MKNIKEISINSEYYPESLRNIKNPPAKLYALGNVELLSKPSIAVVGTRNITDYGIKNCKYFSKMIVKNDIPIVSGMAIGTDSVAHKTALKYGGETIAVLAGGFNHIFPKENMMLFEDIIKRKGLVITEYSPDINVNSERFLERNRIVSGLSEGVLIIEAGYRSGTSVTAKLAYRQGKVVMALPGRLDNPYGVGVNKLIQKGARLVICIEDVLCNVQKFKNKLNSECVEEQITFFDVEDEYKEILQILQNGTLSAEEIMQKTKKCDLRDTLNKLINMELEGIIVQEIGVGYRVK